MRNIVLFPRLSTELLSALIVGVSFIHVRKMAALHWLYNAHTVGITDLKINTRLGAWLAWWAFSPFVLIT